METNMGNMKRKKQIESVLLICALVATSMIVVFPLTVPPKARGQIIHLASAAAEDIAGLPYDTSPSGDGLVVWDPNDNHIISNVMGYMVDPGFTLDIPAMNYDPMNPMSFSIDIQMGLSIDVLGTLITNSDGIGNTKTAFLTSGLGTWDGIYFLPGSQGTINDCLIRQCDNGVQFTPGSKLISPGITRSHFEDFTNYGVRMDNAQGYTNIHDWVNFTSFNGIGLDVSNGSVNVTNSFPNISNFMGHGAGQSSLRITNATASVDNTYFDAGFQPGYSVHIRDNPTPNSSVLSDCFFMSGLPDNYYIQCNGSSAFIEDATFMYTGGDLTIIANDNATDVQAHPILRNPINASANYFDNSTCNATGNSTVLIQWYKDVYVKDPDNNPIGNAPVWVIDDRGNPAEPPTQTTDDAGDKGYARDFVVNELLIHNDSVDNFNLFNVSAKNGSVFGYAIPEETINITKENTIIVPFSLEPRYEPNVTWITTPVGIQSGLITIQYIVVDLNPGDNGSLSVEVEFSTDGTNWGLATQGGGDPTTGLDNNTIYTFIWDSEGSKDLPDQYNNTVYMRVVPYDGYGAGISNQTDVFTVDNMAPILVSGPTVTGLTNNTATIVWEMDEACNATVWYGLDPDLTDEASNNSETTVQWVTLTNLEPGRNYSYVINSTDLLGHTYSSYGGIEVYWFHTEVHIQLYAGWNMISVPPDIPNSDLGAVLAPIAGDWDTVWTYYIWDLEDPWKLNDTNNPSGSDLHEIIPGAGYWIHMINNAVLILDHDIPEGLPVPYPLFQGWNLIGYPSALTRSTDDALSGVQYDVVKTYDAATGKWLSYDGSTGDLTQMEMGRGYWIYVTEDVLWSLPYA